MEKGGAAIAARAGLPLRCGDRLRRASEGPNSCALVGHEVLAGVVEARDVLDQPLDGAPAVEFTCQALNPGSNL